MTPEDFCELAFHLLGEDWDAMLCTITGIPLRSIEDMAEGRVPPDPELAGVMDAAYHLIIALGEHVEQHGPIESVRLDVNPDVRSELWLNAIVKEAIERTGGQPL